MNRPSFSILLGMLLLPVGALSQQAKDSKPEASGTGVDAGAVQQTPAQRQIRGAQRQVDANPERANLYNELALAYIHRAREADDMAYLENADKALVRGLRIDASDFQLQRTQVAVMLARHQYSAAEEKARILNKHTPDDVMTYGYLAEAEIALGDLEAAEKNAQWMLNMRPNNIPGLLIGAKLRVLYHDSDGALDLLKMAYSETAPSAVEDLAWIANQMASIQIDAGQNDAATQTLAQAEAIFPKYPYTEQNLSRILLSGKASAAPEEDRSVSGVAGGFAKSHPPGTASARAEIDPVRVAPTFPSVPASLLIPKPTETDRQIHSAQALVTRDPKDASAYANLGATYFQRARETGDVSDYQLAEDSLTKSLDLDSSDFSADEPFSSMASVCMGEHRFNDALTYAHKALSLGSGDVSSFAIIGDAYADIGEYDKAAQAYERLTPRDMTLSPRAAYARDSRVAYLKFIDGNTPAAIALMKVAVAEGTEAQLPRENLAWLYFELGEFYVQAGDTAAADHAYMASLATHPGDYRALASLGKLRANNGRYQEAIVLYKSAIAVVPMPIFISELGDLYVMIGDQAEAKKQFQLVEYIGLLGHINQVLHNRDLAIFYADHDLKLTEALELAQKELEVRQDIYTWDALSWALYKNHRYEEASKASEKALKYGTQDALLRYHAGMIAESMGHVQQAIADLKHARNINPHFHLLYADEAEKHLAELNQKSVLEVSHAR